MASHSWAYDSDAYARMQGGMDEPGTASWKTLQRRHKRKRNLKASSTTAPDLAASTEICSSGGNCGREVTDGPNDGGRWADVGTGEGSSRKGKGGSEECSGSDDKSNHDVVVPLGGASTAAVCAPGGPMKLEDMSVCCRDCKKEFIFNKVEQKLFLEKEWPIPRQRCEDCTLRRKNSKKKKPGKHERGLAKADGHAGTAMSNTEGSVGSRKQL